jgi:serine/threonine protein kinase
MGPGDRETARGNGTADMNRELTQDEGFEQQLTAWEEKLAQGEDVTVENGSTPEQDSKLHRGLAWLKQLNSLRRRKAETPTSPITQINSLNFSPVKYKLPTRFGKFDLLKELGRGGFGVVFLARDRVLQTHVALKMPHSHVLTNDGLRERFLREARVAAGLQHPHIVAVHEAGEIGPVHYIVYSYCSGISLSEWMRLQKEQVNAQQAADWIACLAEAVAYAHSKGVLHRDLKPANILLHQPEGGDSTIIVGTQRFGTSIPKITDFGLAKLEREKQQTATGAILGTPMYMAPEQASSKSNIGPAVDIHALGVLLYELLAGQPPYRGESDYETLQLVTKAEPLPLRKHRPRLSRDLETICLKCLQKDPGMRYASASDLAADLRRFQAGAPIKARPVSMIERSWRLCKRYPLVASLMLALLIALAGGATGIFYQNQERGKQAEATKAWLAKYLGYLRKEVTDAQEMLADVRTERRGKDKLLSMLPYFEALLVDPQTEPSLQLETARLASQVGGIHQSLGEFGKAAERYQQSSTIFSQVRKASGSTTDLVIEQTTAMAKLAFSLRSQSKYASSERVYRETMTLLENELKVQPENTTLMDSLANVLVYNCGNLSGQKRQNEVEQSLKQAMVLVEKALQIKPDNDRLLLTQAFVIDDLGLYYMTEKNWEEADKLLTQALAIRQAMYQQAPQLAGLAVAVARSHWRLGNLYRAKERYTEAEESYQRSIDLNDQSQRDNPDMPGIAHNAAWDRVILSGMLEEQKRYQEEERHLKEAYAIRKKCREQFPQHMGNQYELVNTCFRLANIYKLQNNHAELDRYYQEGMEVSERLLREFPDEIKAREVYSSRLRNIARYYEEQKNQPRLDDVLNRLLVTRERLVVEFPTMHQYKRDLDTSYSRLASQHRARREWKQAAEIMGRIVQLREQIITESENPARDTHTLAQRLLAWGRDLTEQYDHVAALEKFTRAIQLYHQLEKSGYSLAAMLADYGNTLMQAGYEHMELKQWKQAHLLFKQALPLREQLYHSKPSAFYSNVVAKCHYMLANSYWHGHHDLPGFVYHYTISSVIDPAYTSPVISPKLIIRVLHGWAMANAQSSKPK